MTGIRAINSPMTIATAQRAKSPAISFPKRSISAALLKADNGHRDLDQRVGRRAGSAPLVVHAEHEGTAEVVLDVALADVLVGVDPDDECQQEESHGLVSP